MTNEKPGRIGLAYYQAACLTLLLALVGFSIAGVSVDEVTERWRDLRSDALALERRAAARQVLLWLIALAVCLPLYAFHHRVVARAAATAEHDGV